MYTEVLAVLMHFSCVMLKPTFNCKLPFGCEINDVQFVIDNNGNEKTSMGYPGLLCDIRNETFQFDYKMPSSFLKPGNQDWCHISTKLKYEIMEFRFPINFILSMKFNFQKMLNYMWFFEYNVDVNFVNLKGFELVIKNKKNIPIQEAEYFRFQCIRCKIEFYSKGRHIKTCEDIMTNSVSIRSLFQIQRLNSNTMIILFHSEFKTTLCPLVFKNSNISQLEIVDFSDTFYKRNILKFENRTFDNLNSTIKYMRILKAENLNIDSNLLNPSVFIGLELIFYLVHLIRLMEFL
jgi:hypothetical protein